MLFIVTDDQRADGHHGPDGDAGHGFPRFENAGIDFTNAYGTTPQCCPGRARRSSAGRFSHNNGVFDNSATAQPRPQRDGPGLPAQQPATGPALFGKFLNNWDLNDNPPNFDDWSILTAGYCPFIVNEQGVRKTYPAGPDMKPVDGDGKCEPAGPRPQRRRAVLDRLHPRQGRCPSSTRASRTTTSPGSWS